MIRCLVASFRPRIGVPRVLPPLYLNTNGDGSLLSLERYVGTNGNDETGNGTITNPYRTILRAARSIQDQQGTNADGGIINLLPGNYSGLAYDRPDLFAQGYALHIAPFDRPGVDPAYEDPSQNYALALQPYPGSLQPQTLAIVNGSAGSEYWTARLYKLPNRSLDFTTASVYTLANR